jgi:hypothetical protein
MKFLKHSAAALAMALAALTGSSVPALAITNSAGETATAYVAAFAPVIGSAIPHTGDMALFVHDGTITGTYTGTSVAPDPLNDRIVSVTGTISPSDGHVQLYIGGALSLQGSMNADGSISGTASYLGRLYEFEARPGATRPG